jgi:hypothetical protein
MKEKKERERERETETETDRDRGREWASVKISPSDQELEKRLDQKELT